MGVWEASALLELTSDAWGKLMGPYGTGEKVPALLQQLMQEYDQETANGLFQEYLFHQNTIYTVTYAAVPYLAQMARSTADPEVRRDLFITCGIIEASRDRNEATPFPAAWAGLADQVGAPTCSDIFSSYIEAIREMASLGEDVRAHTADAPVDESEKRYILVADAAYRGSHPLANMLMTFSSGMSTLPYVRPASRMCICGRMGKTGAYRRLPRILCSRRSKRHMKSYRLPNLRIRTKDISEACSGYR